MAWGNIRELSERNIMGKHHREISIFREEQWQRQQQTSRGKWWWLWMNYQKELKPLMGASWSWDCATTKPSNDRTWQQYKGNKAEVTWYQIREHQPHGDYAWGIKHVGSNHVGINQVGIKYVGTIHGGIKHVVINRGWRWVKWLKGHKNQEKNLKRESWNWEQGKFSFFLIYVGLITFI